MDLEEGLCFAYRVANGVAGVETVQYAMLLAPAGPHAWSAAPLVHPSTVPVALLPVHPEQDARDLVDGATRPIPELLLDNRSQNRIVFETKDGLPYRPVLVAHERLFRSYLAVYRVGLLEVFRITMERRDVQSGPRDGIVERIMEDDFPISPFRHRILLRYAPCPLDLLGAAPGPRDRLGSALHFRHALADEFYATLRKCAAKCASISFELRALDNQRAAAADKMFCGHWRRTDRNAGFNDPDRSLGLKVCRLFRSLGAPPHRKRGSGVSR
ncbi:hypothetical protein B484DRAFT_467362 [Ochromonadaceae sp. CCMP2298]|nr:hypothetical protein B484DRAFT_467362 [Ochromonadaceae sp. CCMP2298]